MKKKYSSLKFSNNFSNQLAKSIEFFQIIFFIIILITSNFLYAQKAKSTTETAKNSGKIFLPDGLRMPGDWNGWTNNTGMGGNFDLQRTTIGTLRWSTTFQYTGNTGNQNFKFVSSSSGNVWTNQWAGNTNVTLNTLANVTFGSPSDPNNTIYITQNKWYKVVFEDKGYQNSRAIFMETSAEPVAIEKVAQNPPIVASNEPVIVGIQLSSIPSVEEKFYLRYSTNNWSSSSIASFSINDLNGTATIPDQISNTRVDYYVFSTTITNPSADYDLVTMKINNNNGNNYAYVVDQQADCGSYLVTTNPFFPFENSQITITFNAELGNGALNDYAGDIYIHTGVKIKDLNNNNIYDWSYVKTEWGVNTPETKLTRVSGEDNLYTITINNIRSYYGVASNFSILQMVMVFRSEEEVGTEYLVHKNNDWSDIYLNVYEDELNVQIVNHATFGQVLSSPLPLSICVEANQASDVEILVNEIQLFQTASNSFTTLLPIHYFDYGMNEIKVIASSGSKEQAEDIVNVYLRGPVPVASLPSGVINGINYIDEATVTLVLHDPPGLKQFVYTIGDFNNWSAVDEGYMNQTPDGMYFWKTITGLTPGEEYAFQYLIDDKLRLADPYATKILDPWNDQWITTYNYPDLKPYPNNKTNGIVSVLQTAQQEFSWQASGFIPPDVRDLVISELHIRDFVESDAIKDVLAKLDYLQSLGVNAIELMPINEFEGNDSWGYNPSFYFAPDKAYGKEFDYKTFIDECHKRGIAVIIDMVLNHSFGQSPLVQMYFDPDAGDFGQTSADNPWYNQYCPHEPWCWGYDFDHMSPYTQQFVDSVLSFWLLEYKVDGFRFDFSKGFTNYDAGNQGNDYNAQRVSILKRIANHIWSKKPGACMILEHFVTNDEEKELANYGMLIWGNMESRYAQATMGWEENSDLTLGLHTARGYTYHNLVSYMESHDEERIMYKNLNNGNSYNSNHDVKQLNIALARNELAAAFYFVAPGPKMIWQFGDLGYDYSIEYNGRTGRKPVRWDYYDVPNRKKLHDTYSKLIQLKKEHPVFRTGNINYSLDSYLKRIHLNENPDGSGMKVTLLGNFDVVGRNITPYFQQTGNWYEFFTGNTHYVNNTTDQIWLEPGEYRLYSSEPFYQVYYSKSTGSLNDLSTWGTNPNGSGISPANFSTIRSHYHVVNNSNPSVSSEWNISGYFSRLYIGDRINPVNLTVNNNLTAGIIEISANATLTCTTNTHTTINDWIKNEGEINLEPGSKMTVISTLSQMVGEEGLILKSNSDLTGSLIHNTVGVQATIQRHFPEADWSEPGDGWHLLASPVPGQAISGAWTPTGTLNDYDFYQWDEPTHTWLNQKVVGNYINAFESGIGYLAAYQQLSTKTFKGNINVNNVTIPLTRSSIPGSTNHYGWNLLGNPFASALDWSHESWNRNENIGGVAKIWHNGGYIDIDSDDPIIPSANGFFVFTDENLVEITIPAAARVHDVENWYKSTGNRFLLTAKAAGADILQRSVIKANPQATAGFDLQYDSRFMSGFAPIFYSIVNDVYFSTNTLPQLTAQTAVPMGFVKNQADDFEIELLETIPDFEVYLTDVKLNIEHNLSKNPVYAFSSQQGDEPGRFLLHFGSVGISDRLPGENLLAWHSNGELFIKNSGGKTRLTIYDVQGRLLKSHTLTLQELNIIPMHLPTGVYILNLTGSESSQSVKVAIY